jgi:hypothetical protein
LSLASGNEDMTSGRDIADLYQEFTEALTEVLAENSVGPARRGRLARASAAAKKHPKYTEHEYFLAVGSENSIHWARATAGATGVKPDGFS